MLNMKRAMENHEGGKRNIRAPSIFETEPREWILEIQKKTQTFLL